jgi:heme exporter protein CcmD
MDFSAPHAGFVIASYMITTIVLVGLVVVIWLGQRRALNQLKTLEERGGRRRRTANNKETT